MFFITRFGSKIGGQNGGKLKGSRTGKEKMEA